MRIRPMTPADLERLEEIDGTIESTQYLHLERAGEGLTMTWKLEERALREKLIEPNRLDDERRFTVKQLVGGADEGLALVAEHEGDLVAAAVARLDPEAGTLRLVDLRVDYDFRRQGVATAMVYQVISDARERGTRAVAAETLTNNDPGNRLLSKLGFDISGVDTRRKSNHDLVKEAVTLFWYAALD